MLLGVLASGAAAQTGVQFDGSNDYITFGTAASLGTPTFTIEVWFKRTAAGTTTSSGTGGVTDAIPLLTKGRGEAEGGTVDMNYFLGIRESDDVLFADYEEGTGQASPALNHPVIGVTPIRNDVWYHAAATFDGSNFRLFLNGVLEATVAVGAGRLPQSASIQHAGLATGLTSTGVAGGFFAGVLDEARVWNHARPTQGIRDSMTLQIASAPGLLGRWGLNEGTLTTAGNSVGGGPAGTLTNGPLWVPGSPFALANAIDFGGSNAYVTFGDASALDLAQFTLETWFRRDAAGVTVSTGSGGFDAIPLLTKGRHENDGSNVDMNWFLGIRESDDVLMADFEEGASGATPGQNHPIVGVTPILNGTWYHAAATYDGGTWKLYLNGGLEATLVVGQPVQSASVQPAALGSALSSTGAAEGFLDGVLDEARVWNSARSQAQIQASMNSQLSSAQAGLVARWSLDEGAGTAVNGSAGTTVNGTITGADWSWASPAPFNASPPSPPAAPTGLAASPVSWAQMRLTWSDAANNETGYEVERSTTGSGGPFSPLLTLPANTATALDQTVLATTNYCYRVRATNSAGPSTWATAACATTPAADHTALDLGGSDAYGVFGNPAALHLTQFTIETWLRRDGPGVGTNTGTGGIPDAIPLVSKGRAENENPGNDINYLFGIRASDGVLCADFEEGAAGASPSLNHPVAGVTPIGTGVWHHAAVTYDGGTWKLYLDGMLENSLLVGQPVASACSVAVALGSALTSADVASGFFDGALDEVRLWSVARTQAEIQSAANAKLVTTQPGLVARWSLDEGIGTVIGASAGTTANGSITGAAWTWTTGAPFNLAFNMPPAPAAPVFPADNATNQAGAPATLRATGTDPDGGNVTVQFYGRPLGAPPGPDFTLIGLPDTQFYVSSLNGGSPAIFDSQTQWIVANRAARNIVYLAQLGDCTQNGDNGGNPVEWNNANASLSLLENPGTTGLPQGIPFGVCVGNHDQSPGGDAAGTTNFYNQYFGVSRFTGRTYYGGHYGSNNDNWYDLFSASGMDFIVISFEFDPAPDAAVLAWADNLLTTYASRRAIIVSHFIINSGNPGTFGPQGQAIYDALKNHPNLFLMLSGHVSPPEGQRVDTWAGNTVHSIMSDYQGRANGGEGWLRIYEFSPANDVIRVRTYSPWLGQFETDADSSSQFTVPYEMSSSAPWVPIGSAVVASGQTASVAWAGLAATSTYEWYATTSDGVSTVVGPVRRFTTGETTAPTAHVVFPDAGGSVNVGQNVTLRWTAVDNVSVSNVDLLLSRNGVAGTYTPIATAIANTGSRVWTATGPVTTDAWLKVVAHDPVGNAGEDVSDNAFAILTTTGVGDDGPVTEFELGPVAPNPIAGRGRFSFAVPAQSHVRVVVHDVLGREVAVLADAVYPTGRHQVAWDGRARTGGFASTGLYFLRFQAAGHAFTRRFALVR